MAEDEIFISTGELSGDLHAANLLRALRRPRPGLKAFGIGGPNLERAGFEKTAGIERLSLMGLVEVVPRLASIYRLMEETKRLLSRRKPKAALLVDSPDFNLRLARHIHALGIKVVYYIGPTVWAWRRGRMKTIAGSVDLMLAILPFEEELYRRAGVRARYVGHPLLDDFEELGAEEARRRLGLEGEETTVALLPGSRGGEIRRLLPHLVEAGRILSRRKGPIRFLIPAASAEAERLIRDMGAADLPGSIVTRAGAALCLAAADAAAVTSGTATLEASLAGVPFVTVYRFSPLTYAVGRRLVSTPDAALPNIILGRRAVPELIQGDCRPDAIAAGIGRFLDDGEAALRMRQEFATIRNLLGPGGAALRAAEALAGEAGLAPAR